MTEQNLTLVTKAYYDSREADEFYYHIWGGEDIHVGIYDNEHAIKDASRNTVIKMANILPELNANTLLLDIGSGYGGAARYLAAQYGCKVDCLNLSETENKRNEQLTAAAGLTDQIHIMSGNFEDMPTADSAYDVVWSQDAILHSDKKQQVFQEVFRVLKSGGYFIFTDPMQSDDCPEGVLQPVLDRIHLKEMGSVEWYRNMLKQIGFKEEQILEMPDQLTRHYRRVLEEVEQNYDNIVLKSGKEYIDRMMVGLNHWITAGEKGYLNWAIFLFKKP